ncbi:McrB family protein [Fodinibius sp. SL11]|uniref:McrB family protein n=1 Tax=Fodinibius sp. SL11 TaxID=3425690 RepID=UPI003F880542
MLDTESQFTWVQTHKEIVAYLADKEGKQKEIIELLKSAGITKSFTDQNADGEKFDLQEIDPFTFFNFIYKYSANRLTYLKRLAQELGIHVPQDALGLPSIQGQNVWCFPYKATRTNNEIERLWSFFHSVRKNEVTEEGFADALDIDSVAEIKLTQGMFFVDPETYFPINGPAKPFLREKFNIDPDFESFEEYQSILKAISDQTDKPFYELSYEAWQWSEESSDREFDDQWESLLKVINRISDESAVRKFFSVAGDVLNELQIENEHQNVYASALNNYIQVTLGSRYIANVKRGKNNTILGFYIKEEMLEEIKNKYPTITAEAKDPIDGSLKRVWVEIVADKVDPNDFYEGVLALAREGYERQSKSQYRSQYADKHNPWVIRAALEDTLQDKLFINYYLVGAYWNKEENPDQTDRFIEEGIWENGYDEKYIEEINSIAVGSKIAIKSVYTKNKTDSVMAIKARGVVTKNPQDGKTLKVDWEPNIDSFELNFSGGYWNTVSKVDNRKHIAAVWYDEPDEEVLDNDEEGTQAAHEYKNNMNFPLNTIFYGPPGTGKTYHTIQRAVEIVEDKKVGSYEEAKEKFNQYLHDTIEFITFHQNYSYEDFIQGLRPDIENQKDLTFERKEGIFKKLADKAKQNLINAQTVRAKKQPFKEVFKEFIAPLVEGKVEEIEVEMTRVSYYITGVNPNGIEFRKASGGTAHNLNLNTLEKMYEAESTLEMQGLSIYYQPLLDRLLELGKSDTEKERIKRKNYVIIIDEINRANISRVFGELITLIEPDKRYDPGKRSDDAIPLTTTLPSGESFSVPSNLYLIGTMNTADKSVALLDIALRRRFEFEAMYPQYTIDGEELPDADILKKINKRIVDLKGHDFQIGHSYFMDKDITLKERMNKKVIPLLLEYFMNDEDEVRGILSHAGLDIKEDVWPLQITGRA